MPLHPLQSEWDAGVRSVSLCVGEGGSGGALAFLDRLLTLAHASFSVIPADGAAAVLDPTSDTAPKRATHLPPTSTDLLGLGTVDEVIPEHDAPVRRARALDEAEPGQRHVRFDAATMRAFGP